MSGRRICPGGNVRIPRIVIPIIAHMLSEVICSLPHLTRPVVGSHVNVVLQAACEVI